MPQKPRSKSNGEGSIYYIESKELWCGKVCTGRNSNGRLQYKYFYSNGKKDVVEKVNKIKSELSTGKYNEPSKMLFKDWLDIWLNEYKRNIRNRTYEGYEYLIRVHVSPKLGHIPLSKLNTNDIQMFYNALHSEGRVDKSHFGEGLSAKTIKKIHTVIHSALKQACRNQLIINNQSEHITLPKQKKSEATALTPTEQTDLLNSIKNSKHRLWFLFYFDIYTGLRIGELLALTWSSINFDEQYITVSGNLQRQKDLRKGKTKSELTIDEVKTETSKRIVPISNKTMEYLKVYLEQQQTEKEKAGDLYLNNDLVFATELGKMIEPNNIRRILMKHLELLEIQNITMHSLRHTFATRLIEKGVGIKTVQELLGHKDIQTTLNIYTHIRPEIKKDAITMLDD